MPHSLDQHETERILGEVLQEQLLLHRSVQLQDVCKLLYQAAFGCEHLTSQEESTADSLWNEFQNPPHFADKESLIERIDPTNVVCRLNLRPYKAVAGTFEPLRAALLQSTERIEDGSRRFRALWDALANLTNARALPFSPAEADQLRARYLAGDPLPPFRHSEAYREANRPCYRVLRVAYLPSLAEADGRHGIHLPASPKP